MGALSKLVFRGDAGQAIIELHDENTFVQYPFHDPDATFDTLSIMEQHLIVGKYDGFLRHGTLRGRGGVRYGMPSSSIQ